MLPVSGAAAPNICGADGYRPRISFKQAELELAVAGPAEVLVEEDRPQPLGLHLILQALDQRLDLRVPRPDGVREHVLERLHLFPAELLDPVELLLELGLGGEVPTHQMTPVIDALTISLPRGAARPYAEHGSQCDFRALDRDRLAVAGGPTRGDRHVDRPRAHYRLGTPNPAPDIVARRNRRILGEMAGTSLPARQLNRRSSGGAAALYIRKLIFDGYLRPGARVHQDDVAQALGVSRIPVREALIALEQQGWVTIEPNRGAFVAVLDEQAVRDHYELYGLVYGFAAKKALERSDGVLGEKLGQLAADYSSTTDPAEAQQIALAFHAAVIEAAGSPRIDVVLRALSALVPGDFYELVPDAMELQRAGFTAIAGACRCGDGDGAARRVRRDDAEGRRRGRASVPPARPVRARPGLSAIARWRVRGCGAGELRLRRSRRRARAAGPRRSSRSRPMTYLPALISATTKRPSSERSAISAFRPMRGQPVAELAEGHDRPGRVLAFARASSAGRLRCAVQRPVSSRPPDG